MAAPVAPAAPAVFRISPRAAALAEHSVIDATRVKGTGPEGRVVEKDVQNYLQQHGYGQLRISPAAKELAAREKLDVLAIQAAENSGRITVADVERAIAERPKLMSNMRQVIAQRLTQSFRDTPHFYVTISVDMTELLGYRNQLKAAGAPYTVTDFIAQAVTMKLGEFPEDEQLDRRQDHALEQPRQPRHRRDGRTRRGRARDPRGGAIAVDRGSPGESKTLIEKARAGKATPDELSGGTFTISNMGMMDVESFGPIINPGGSAVLGVASIKPQPVVRGDKIVVRHMMKLTTLVRPSHRGRRARREVRQRHQTKT